VVVSWTEDPASLLAAPRGRRLCLALVAAKGRPARASIGRAWEQVGFDSPGGDPAGLAAELAAAVSRTDWHAVLAGISEADLVALLAESVSWAMYWQPPDGVDRALAHEEVAGQLGPVAHAVTGAPAAHWWASGVELGSQQHLQAMRGNGGEELVLSGAAERLAAWLADTADDERRAASRPADPAAPYSGYWWSSPRIARQRPGPVSTTRALPGHGPLQLTVVEDWPGWAEVRCWPVKPTRAPRVYEITGPGDWAALVARYPLDVTLSRRHDWWKVTGRAGTWLIPNYAAAAADYDAIHLTIGGYLTTAGRALPAGHACSLLAGWDPDETYWLADILTSAGPPQRWVWRDGPQLGWWPEPARDV
jgi:hypothetical protein